MQFEEHVKELEVVAKALHQSVQSLWARLEVPLKQQNRILEQIKGFRPKDIQLVMSIRTTWWSGYLSSALGCMQLREELQRLDELKSQHMEAFILKTRAELRATWVECLYGVQQQREFAPAFVDGTFDDDLLSAHESELDRMRGFYQDNAEVFELVKKRQELYKQYLEMEVCSVL